MDITKNKATLKTVAKELKISVSTVSRAFTQPDSVKPATLAMIRETSRKLNYKPNLNARALVQQKTHVIAVILQSLKNQTTETLINKLTKLLSLRGYDIHLFVTYSDNQLNNDAINSVLCRGYDGVIINHGAFEGKMEAIETLIKEQIPFVVLGQYDYSTVSQVIGDFKLAGRVITKYLIELGHKNIAFATTCNGDPRYEGYVNMLNQHGLPVREDMVFTCQCTQDDIYEVAKKISKTNTTALFANFDELATRFIRAFKEIGMSIPQQISVVGVGNEMYSDLISPPLTTFEIDTAHLAENLVECLFERIEKPNSPTRTILLNGSLIARESTIELKD
ncbi:MAG: LacI family DNA-binding transcriptional regulator [Sedimentisphaeraceae bacterium JB056]